MPSPLISHRMGEGKAGGTPALSAFFHLAARHALPTPAMNSRLQNLLTMVGSCITVANGAEHKSVWDGEEPADFGTDLTLVATGYGALVAKAAQAEAAVGGAADTKAVAETALEDAAFVLARALVVHFKKTGNLTDLATVAVAQPNAAKRGVTAARVAALSAGITAFSSVMNAPRGGIVNRSALLREVETDGAALAACRT